MNVKNKGLLYLINKWCFWIGLGIASCQLIFFAILGQDVVVTFHDQLDGEMIAYILQAKHLFQGTSLPEFMGGAYKSALTLPAPMSVLLFLTGEYFGAFVSMQILGIIIGYVGMFLLAKKASGKRWVATIVAVIFVYLPFLPVYGLSQWGIPLLFWCFWELAEGKHRHLSLSYGIFFALNSSLVLVGFGILGLLAVMILREYVNKKKIKHLVIGWGAILLTYALENWRLLGQLLGMGEGELASHKTEYTLKGASFWYGLKEAFLFGGDHSADYHIWLLWAFLITAAVLILLLKSSLTNHKKNLKRIMLLLEWIIVLALVSAGWNSYAGVEIREKLGALGSFQLGRVLWISPVLWYLLAACVVGVIADLLSKGYSGFRKAVLLGVLGCNLTLMAVTGYQVLESGNLKANVCRVIGKEYASISYQEYYALGVLDQVKEYIYETTGEAPEEYRVLSLGIDPAAAYYNGFYCLDGYSNNYSLDYKHNFRRIIQPELEKNDYLKSYFDEWGNRCYLVSSQIPGYYTFEKYTSYFWNYAIDTQAAKEMGAKYVFSAVYLTNAEEIGLKRVREEEFVTPESYYAIYLYEIE